MHLWFSLLLMVALTACGSTARKAGELAADTAAGIGKATVNAIESVSKPTPASPTPASTPVTPAVTESTKPANGGSIRNGPVSMDWLVASTWEALPGWNEDDISQAWPALLQSCKTLRRQSAWSDACNAAERLGAPDTADARRFFERHFTPYQINQAEGGDSGLVTGYYEPLLRGSRSLSWRNRHPIYAAPDDLLIVDLGDLFPEIKGKRVRGRVEGRKVVPYHDRAAIESGKARLAGKEIAFVEDPIELFFLQVQGSGRIQLEDGSILRIGYADQNGYPYKSIGKWLVEQGELTLPEASMQGIQDWARRNPQRLNELLNVNPSYVFFREMPDTGGGPVGALGVPLTPQRSIAIDPRGMPLGAPVWLSTTWPNSSQALNRLMLAQDTGGAIRGNVRADFFWGFGPDAGKLAGAMKQRGRMWTLLPRDYPLALSRR